MKKNISHLPICTLILTGWLISGSSTFASFTDFGSQELQNSPAPEKAANDTEVTNPPMPMPDAPPTMESMDNPLQAPTGPAPFPEDNMETLEKPDDIPGADNPIGPTPGKTTYLKDKNGNIIKEISESFYSDLPSKISERLTKEYDSAGELTRTLKEVFYESGQLASQTESIFQGVDPISGLPKLTHADVSRFDEDGQRSGFWENTDYIWIAGKGLVAHDLTSFYSEGELISHQKEQTRSYYETGEDEKSQITETVYKDGKISAGITTIFYNLRNPNVVWKTIRIDVLSGKVIYSWQMDQGELDKTIPGI